MRCFLGINLNASAEELSKIKLSKIELDKAKEYHLTLKFFTDLPEEKVGEIKKKLKNISIQSFTLIANKIVAFPNKGNPQLYALGFENKNSLMKLYQEVKTIIDLENEVFNPHITLYRKKELSPDFKKTKEFYKDIEPINIEISSFGLYKSEPNKGMNSYVPIFTINLK